MRTKTASPAKNWTICFKGKFDFELSSAMRSSETGTGECLRMADLRLAKATNEAARRRGRRGGGAGDVTHDERKINNGLPKHPLLASKFKEPGQGLPQKLMRNLVETQSH